MKREDYQPLGKYIEQVNVRNRVLHDLPLLGVSVEKRLIPSVANINGTDMSNYKILGNKEFGKRYWYFCTEQYLKRVKCSGVGYRLWQNRHT